MSCQISLFFRCLKLELLAKVAVEAIEVDAARVEVLSRFAVADLQIQHLSQLLLAELETEKLANRLYAESSANALAVHLIREYSTIEKTVRQYSGGLSLAWLLHQGTIPIVGARKAAQVKDNLDCVNVKLSEQLAHLDQVSQIELGFPHDFFNQEMPQSFIFGGQFQAIDNHRYTQIH